MGSSASVPKRATIASADVNNPGISVYINVAQGKKQKLVFE